MRDVEVGAFCGRDTGRLEFIGEKYPGAKLYSDYEQLLNDRDIDAVIVANYADEHVEPCCRAMKAGKHVLSEVPACTTVAEGVKLAQTVDETGQVYMFGENFCYMSFVQEMRRLYQSGELGEFTFAEGEYVHWSRNAVHKLIDLSIPHHWRTWIYPTFYITHSIGPILYVTGLRPVAVMAATGLLENAEGPPRQSPVIELVRLENGALVKSMHGAAGPREPWQPWYQIVGSRGCVENKRWPDPSEVTVYLEKEGKARAYRAEFPRYREEAKTIQHWGADLFLLEEFIDSIRTGRTPEIDVYLGLDMTLCGIMAWRSVLAGRWVDVPNLRKEDEREKWKNDHCSCRPGTPEKFLLPNNSRSDSTVLPSQEMLARIRKEQDEEPYNRSIYRD